MQIKKAYFDPLYHLHSGPVGRRMPTQNFQQGMQVNTQNFQQGMQMNTPQTANQPSVVGQQQQRMVNPATAAILAAQSQAGQQPNPTQPGQPGHNLQQQQQQEQPGNTAMDPGGSAQQQQQAQQQGQQQRTIWHGTLEWHNESLQVIPL